MGQVEILRCDFSNQLHCDAEVELMREYMLDKMGDAVPLSESQNAALIEGLSELPTALVLLARYEGEFVGLTNGFVNFGTFAAKRFLNIHDVIVKSSCRGIGVGRLLLEENVRVARDELDCAKVTLEVRSDNVVAQGLYRSLGFGECIPQMHFWNLML